MLKILAGGMAVWGFSSGSHHDVSLFVMLQVFFFLRLNKLFCPVSHFPRVFMYGYLRSHVYYSYSRSSKVYDVPDVDTVSNSVLTVFSFARQDSFSCEPASKKHTVCCYNFFVFFMKIVLIILSHFPHKWLK